ncbi:hypothetical protein ABFB09_05245 [Dehalogenimonas sp. THU2]|uniref:hypothetical protein n=1 Tax=Dehalogenimonas sp. THU2 TaxID=3151121 RepID=UPI003218C25B
MMKNTPKTTAIIYSGLSLLGAALFLLVTTAGDYTTVERIGGAVWVFILLMIILIPAVSAFFKR